MDTERCPRCDRIIFGRCGRFTCFLCGFWVRNYRTGELERSEYEQAKEEEERRN